MPDWVQLQTIVPIEGGVFLADVDGTSAWSWIPSGTGFSFEKRNRTPNTMHLVGPNTRSSVNNHNILVADDGG